MILINLVAVLLCWTPPTVRHCLRLFIFPLCRMANLSYIRNFCFSHSSKDELSYCLSTFEAAVEYINLGKLHDSPAVGLAHTWLHAHAHRPVLDVVSSSLPSKGSTELSDKAVFREKMHLLGQSAATPILHLFEVGADLVLCGALQRPKLENALQGVNRATSLCGLAHRQRERGRGGATAERCGKRGGRQDVSSALFM